MCGVVAVVFIVELPFKASEEALVCQVNLTWLQVSLWVNLLIKGLD